MCGAGLTRFGMMYTAPSAADSALTLIGLLLVVVFGRTSLWMRDLALPLACLIPDSPVAARHRSLVSRTGT